MILIIDNYDSFVYNLYQFIGEYQTDIKVIRNNALTLSQIIDLNPQKIILSPGPGRPKEAGVMEEVIAYFYNKVPILGICLGHQAICEVFGSTITYAKKIMHGKVSKIKVMKENILLDEEHQVARYHSLVADENTIKKPLQIIARSEDGEVMAVQHMEYPVYGLQFHPESILTINGKQIIKNFIKGEEK
ncbi:MAG: anthranilate synthase component II [Coprobacillaceae bacterium]